MIDDRPLRVLMCGLLALLLAPAGRVLAVDGVIEINQARADKGGVTSGDMPGLPITISTGTSSNEPMSFRLTGPLSTDTSSNVIEILSPYVTVDLNGFMITCLLPLCSGAAISSGQDGITVMNGTVRGFARGVDLTGGSGSRIENMRAYGNTLGLRAGSDCIVRNNIANNNGDDGIAAANGCTVVGNTAFGNMGDGISAGPRSNVIGNTARSNTGFGLNLNAEAAYSQNSINNNTAGEVDSGVPTGLNLCNGSTTCP